MVRLLAFILVGCAVCAGLILSEFVSIGSRRPSPGASSPPAQTGSAAPRIRKPEGPLSNPAQRRRETPSSANEADSPLPGVRLTGVVIGPDLRIAIFALTRANPRVLSEGDLLKGWRLDSISPQRVVLTGPAGRIALTPQPDATLVRPLPPVVVERGRPAAPTAGAPAQPLAVTPIAVGTLSPAAPLRTQDYPYYSPGYYPGYEADYPWGWGNPWDWGNPWGWGWPVGISVGFGGCRSCGFHGGFFRPGFRRFGVGHPGFFHKGFGRSGFAHASFGGGFRGSGRR